jgi:hypothetical protein
MERMLFLSLSLCLFLCLFSPRVKEKGEISPGRDEREKIKDCLRFPILLRKKERAGIIISISSLR